MFTFKPLTAVQGMKDAAKIKNVVEPVANWQIPICVVFTANTWNLFDDAFTLSQVSFFLLSVNRHWQQHMIFNLCLVISLTIYLSFKDMDSLSWIVDIDYVVV